MPHYHREPFLHLADRLGASLQIRTENLLITGENEQTRTVNLPPGRGRCSAS